jgi:hemerythrin-like domain-containing protein
MVRPVDAIRAFHNAFRNDLKGIDTAALETARGEEGLSAAIERYRSFNEMLEWHAHGEEIGIFPVLEQVAPLVAEAYVKDHRGLDSAYDALDRSYSCHDLLETARAAAAFRFHLDMHLGKEETHLYRIFEERVSLPEQAKAVGILTGSVPQERFPDVVAWLFPLIGPNDRESVTRIFQMNLPAEAFAGVRDLIKRAIGDDWAELVRRIPALEARWSSEDFESHTLNVKPCK